MYRVGEIQKIYCFQNNWYMAVHLIDGQEWGGIETMKLDSIKGLVIVLEVNNSIEHVVDLMSWHSVLLK